MRRLPSLLSLITAFIVVTTGHAFAATSAPANTVGAEMVLVYLGLVSTIFALGFAALACVM